MRSLFISDVHLGCHHAHTYDLLKYLDHVKDVDRPQKLYIVGDFIDGWKLQRNWSWDDNCTLVVRKIMTLVKHGTEVIYVSGNHDEFLRKFIHEFEAVRFGRMRFVEEIIHETVDGKQLLVLHGDQFDASIKYAHWLCVLGDIGYSILLRMNRFVNWFRKTLGFRHKWSLSKAVKNKVKQAVNYVSDFEEFLTRYAVDKGCCGVICGHIHTPADRLVNGVRYLNSGDWVETCSAIVEHDDGRIELLEHLDLSTRS